MRHIILFALVVVLFGNSAQAELVRSGTVIASTIGEFAASVSLANLTNQAGLSPGYAAGVDDFATAVAANSHANNTGDWASPQFTLTGTIDLDLGATFSVERFAIWNAFSELSLGTVRHINAFTVFTDSQSNFATATNVGSFTNPELGLDGTIFDLTDSIARYVRVQINSNHGDSQFTQSGEFAFGTTAIPEPSAFLFGAAVCLVVVGARWVKGKFA